MSIILFLSAVVNLILLIFVYQGKKENQRLLRSQERERNQAQAERSELLDRVMVLKGHREYANTSWDANTPEEAVVGFELEPSDDTPAGFEPY